MSKKKILLIDFDTEFLKFLSRHLQEDGFEVITANDGVAGFEKFSELAPDLVIMEAMLPKFHGFELCSRITSHPTKKSHVIIVTSIYKDVAYKTEALKNLGASAYFEKPLNLEELMKKVYEIVGRPEGKKIPLSDNVEDLLQSALSMDKKESKKTTAKEAPTKTRAQNQEADLDQLLEAKLKDILSEKSISEPKPAPQVSTRPTAPPVNKKPASSPAAAEPARTQTKPAESQVQQPKKENKPETKPESSPARGTRVETKPSSSSVQEPAKVTPNQVSTPFESYLNKGEEDNKKKGAGKFIGIAIGAVVVVALVAVFALKKKETPTFSGQNSSQTAAIQSVSSEQPNSQSSDQDLNQQIEKQIADYKSQKSESGSNNQKAAAKTTRKVETPVAAAPITPQDSPSLALNHPATSTPPATTTEEAKVQVENKDNQTEGKNSQTPEQNSQVSNENQVAAIPVTKAKTGDLIPLNMVEVEPRLIKTVEPVFPEVDRRMGIKGNIILNVLISETGDVLEAAVIRGIKGSVALEKEAINAVKKWKFLPAEKDGVKVRVWKPITIGFGANK